MEKDEGFISDGMNAFERNVKRIVDCLLAGIALIIFSPLFLYSITPKGSYSEKNVCHGDTGGYFCPMISKVIERTR